MARMRSVGAECSKAGVDFRVWAQGRHEVTLVLEHETRARVLQPQAEGYFALHVPEARAGTRYRYYIDGQGPFPDLASRFQPEGPEGPSEVIDPGTFPWTDVDWPGVSLRGQVLYELHVGSFTPEGTWAAALSRLPLLRETGITCIELMPVHEFAGEFGWSYDGVDLFAPHARYGRPDELRAFVNTAHRLGMGVILDIVYNHFGPSGCYAGRYSDHFFGKHQTDWGAGPNFDGEHSRAVRDIFCDNACYWVTEFHLDGFRVDATQSIFDDSDEHILAELTRRARAAAAPRSIIVTAENEPQEAKLVRKAAEGGYGLDGLWNDDFHHSAMVRLTGRHQAYYTDYRGRAAELVAAAKYGFLYQGQYYTWQSKCRGSSTYGLSPHQFIGYLENHDQVANSALGARLSQWTQPAQVRALTSLLLLGPWTPLLFQGQEWGSSKPFPYFAHHKGELANLVHNGRRKSLSEFPNFAVPEMGELMPDPSARATFEVAKLDWSERERREHIHWLALHRDLLHLRATDPVLGPHAQGVQLEAAVLNDDCLLLRWMRAQRDDRLLLVNLGPDLDLIPAPEPLLAAPDGRRFVLTWSSEDPRYGGLGQPPFSLNHIPKLPAHAALLCIAQPDPVT